MSSAIKRFHLSQNLTESPTSTSAKCRRTHGFRSLSSPEPILRWPTNVTESREQRPVVAECIVVIAPSAYRAQRSARVTWANWESLRGLQSLLNWYRQSRDSYRTLASSRSSNRRALRSIAKRTSPRHLGGETGPLTINSAPRRAAGRRLFSVRGGVFAL